MEGIAFFVNRILKPEMLPIPVLRHAFNWENEHLNGSFENGGFGWLRYCDCKVVATIKAAGISAANGCRVR